MAKCWGWFRWVEWVDVAARPTIRTGIDSLFMIEKWEVDNDMSPELPACESSA
eukprot:COSAG03_NODE_991_length_5084_cov_86.524774_3_plen_53_part_00